MAIGLIALNLRPFLSGPSAVLPDIMADTDLTWVGPANITVLPFVVMELGAYFTPFHNSGAIRARIGQYVFDNVCDFTEEFQR